MNYYKLEQPLVINESSELPIRAEVGQIVYTDSTGVLGVCEEMDVAEIAARVDREIAENAEKAKAEAEQPEEL